MSCRLLSTGPITEAIINFGHMPYIDLRLSPIRG